MMKSRPLPSPAWVIPTGSSRPESSGINASATRARSPSVSRSAAASTWTRGVTSPLRESVMGTPVVLMTSTISAELAPGSAERSTATAPATLGAAMEVPLLAAKASPGTAETMPTPPDSVSR